MSNIEKFNYLKTKVSGEAKRAILGLTLSKDDYQIAVDILKERFDLLDNNERQNRSLELLKQNINQDVFVSIIRSKLPDDILLQLGNTQWSKTQVDCGKSES